MARLNARVATLGAATTVALAAAGCGGSSSGSSGASAQKVDATTYVTAFCNAVGPFEKDIATRSAALESVKAKTLAADKSVLTSYLKALSQDSATALTKMKAAGVPTVAGGSSFASTIITNFTRVNTALGQAQVAATKLSTTSKSDFTAGADAIDTSARKALSELGTGFKKANSYKGLRSAAAKVSACHTL